MKICLKGASVYRDGAFQKLDILMDNGIIAAVSDDISVSDAKTVPLDGKFIFPGFTDVHVHLREPGFSYKETIFSGSRAAAAGGYTTVCAMPNLNPVPDSLPHLQEELDIIRRDAAIHVLPYGALTVGEKGKELADLEAMAPYVCAFSDDGKGVQSEEMMLSAMKKVRSLGKVLAAHCEDETLLHGGYIHQGAYAAAHGHKGICSESEWGPIQRDIELVKKTGVSYHVCHVSTRESVELIRRAKSEGVNITCETGPHYLVLCEDDLQEDGRFKMNPPLRSREDRQALLEGLLDGTIDVIATDHAPHSAEEKSRGLAGSPMGITGIETAFPVLYTKLVKTGIVPLSRIVDRLTLAPRKRFGLPGGKIEVGQPADLTVFDLEKEFEICPDAFVSKGHATPFAGEKVYGECILTYVEGEEAWRK